MTLPQFDVPYVPENLEKMIQAALIKKAQEELSYKVQEQPWYKKYSNTVSGTAAALLAGIGSVTASVQNLPTYVVVGLAVLSLVLQSLVIKNTKNGITDSVAKKAYDPYVIDGMAQEVAATVQETVIAAHEAIPDNARRAMAELRKRFDDAQKGISAAPQSYSEHG